MGDLPTDEVGVEQLGERGSEEEGTGRDEKNSGEEQEEEGVEREIEQGN